MKTATIFLAICVVGGFLGGALLNWYFMTSSNPYAHSDFLLKTSASAGLLGAVLGSVAGLILWLVVLLSRVPPKR